MSSSRFNMAYVKFPQTRKNHIKVSLQSKSLYFPQVLKDQSGNLCTKEWLQEEESSAKNVYSFMRILCIEWAFNFVVLGHNANTKAKLKLTTLSCKAGKMSS